MKPATRRHANSRSLSADGIKAIARRQMSVYGTAGLSLRGIAREYNVTAPAIYNYFPRLDDLITALVVDAFNALADAMHTAIGNVSSELCAPKIRAAALAYRDWAIDHPSDFQLIYGNPIPGYAAPAEITVPLASRPFVDVVELFVLAHQRGELTVPAEYAELPAPLAAHMADRFMALLGDAPLALLRIVVSSWARMHGMTMLEMFGHLSPVVGDAATFYACEIDGWMAYLGMARGEE